MAVELVHRIVGRLFIEAQVTIEQLVEENKRLKEEVEQLRKAKDSTKK